MYCRHSSGGRCPSAYAGTIRHVISDGAHFERSASSARTTSRGLTVAAGPGLRCALKTMRAGSGRHRRMFTLAAMLGFICEACTKFSDEHGIGRSRYIFLYLLLHESSMLTGNCLSELQATPDVRNIFDEHIQQSIFMIRRASGYKAF